MEPFRALVGDMLPDRQRAFGFAMQSLFIGIGAVVASALPWILANWAGVSNVAGDGRVAGLGEVGVLPRRRRLHRRGARGRSSRRGNIRRRNSPSSTRSTRRGATSPPAGEPERLAVSRLGHGLDPRAAASSASPSRVFGWDRQLHVLGVGGAAFGVLQLVGRVAAVRGRTADALYCIMNDLFLMPRTMRQLAARAVPVVVRPVRDVDLHDLRGDEPPLRHDRRDFRGLQRGRELGRRAVRGLQRLRGARRAAHPARGASDRPPPRAPREPLARRRSG